MQSLFPTMVAIVLILIGASFFIYDSDYDPPSFDVETEIEGTAIGNIGTRVSGGKLGEYGSKFILYEENNEGAHDKEVNKVVKENKLHFVFVRKIWDRLTHSVMVTIAKILLADLGKMFVWVWEHKIITSIFLIVVFFIALAGTGNPGLAFATSIICLLGVILGLWIIWVLFQFIAAFVVAIALLIAGFIARFTEKNKID